MKLVSLHDKREIEKAARRNAYLHIYSIGDLDDFFWPNTVWYALKDGEQVKQFVLLYTAFSTPTMLALTEEPQEMRELLGAAMGLLPRRAYAHLSEGVKSALEDSYAIESHGVYYKMALSDPSRLDTVSTAGVVQLTSNDLHDLEQLYTLSYPGNWFDPRMLESGQYFGMRDGGELVSVAGVHIYSPRYKVAAIGNVTTHPQYRGRGIASSVCARLCQSLLQTVDHVGLNVKADNVAAISAYEKLGFRRIANYEECTLVGR